jgi:hypothetical protein
MDSKKGKNSKKDSKKAKGGKKPAHWSVVHALERRHAAFAAEPQWSAWFVASSIVARRW